MNPCKGPCGPQGKGMGRPAGEAKTVVGEEVAAVQSEAPRFVRRCGFEVASRVKKARNKETYKSIYIYIQI